MQPDASPMLCTSQSLRKEANDNNSIKRCRPVSRSAASHSWRSPECQLPVSAAPSLLTQESSDARHESVVSSSSTASDASAQVERQDSLMRRLRQNLANLEEWIDADDHNVNRKKATDLQHHNALPLAARSTTTTPLPIDPQECLVVSPTLVSPLLSAVATTTPHKGPLVHYKSAALPLDSTSTSTSTSSLVLTERNRLTSYGMIVFRTNPWRQGRMEFALVSRRVSIGYHELICGNGYLLSDLRRIWLLVRDTTVAERDMLLHWSFQDQLNYVFGSTADLSSPSSSSFFAHHRHHQTLSLASPPPPEAILGSGGGGGGGPGSSLARQKFEHLRQGFWWSWSEYVRGAKQQQHQQAQSGNKEATSPATTPPQQNSDNSAEFRHFASKRRLVTLGRTQQRNHYPSGHRVVSSDLAVFVTLEALISAANAVSLRLGEDMNSTRYTFPKGRMCRTEGEDSLTCALRELAEETNIPPNGCDVLCEILREEFLTAAPGPGPGPGPSNKKTLVFQNACSARMLLSPMRNSKDGRKEQPVTLRESFVGLDNQTYTYVYHIARYHPSSSSISANRDRDIGAAACLSDLNSQQMAEIGSVGWYTSEEVEQLLRPAGRQKQQQSSPSLFPQVLQLLHDASPL